jgi:hypothetical protein
MIRKRKLALLILVGGVLAATAHEAMAIIGMPFTPMSYAGVARRTARRTAYVAAAASPYYYYPY